MDVRLLTIFAGKNVSHKNHIELFSRAISPSPRQGIWLAESVNCRRVQRELDQHLFSGREEQPCSPTTTVCGRHNVSADHDVRLNHQKTLTQRPLVSNVASVIPRIIRIDQTQNGVIVGCLNQGVKSLVSEGIRDETS